MPRCHDGALVLNKGDPRTAPAHFFRQRAKIAAWLLCVLSSDPHPVYCEINLSSAGMGKV